MAVKLHIQPSFIKYATKAELKALNRISPELISKAWDLGATQACVMKNRNGRNGLRYARVQFLTDDRRYVSSVYL